MITVNSELGKAILDNNFEDFKSIIERYDKRIILDYDLVTKMSEFNNLEILKYLFDKEFDISYNSKTIINYIDIEEYFEIFEYLVDNNDVDIHVGNDLLLVFMARHGQLEIVKFLVEKSHFDVSKWNYGAIQLAIHYNHLEIADYLKEKNRQYKKLV